MLYALQFLCGLLLLAIFGPPWLLCICNAACGDWLTKRRVRSTLFSNQL